MLIRSCALVAAFLLNFAFGFKEAFQPGNSSHFIPLASNTFAVAPNQLFYLGYADNSHLKGFQGKDVVQLGDYFAYTKFGAITECNSPDFNHIDGIVGFGLPVAHPMTPPPSPSEDGGGGFGGIGGLGGSSIPGFKMPGVPTGQAAPTLPPPILFALTHTRGAEERLQEKTTGKFVTVGNYVHRRAFSFLSTDKAAELQLGGYDPDSIEGHMFLTPSISASDYVTVGLSLKYGSEELLEFTTTNPRSAYLPAIMDSGTSCLVIPDTDMDGLLRGSPYGKWKSIVNDTTAPHVQHSFFLNIAGAEFEIPFDDWFLNLSNQSCVQRSPKGFSGILVGDVLFRRYLVLFDLQKFDEGQVLIGIAKQNKNYVPATKPTKIKDLHKFPIGKQAPGKLTSDTAHPRSGEASPHLKPPMAMDRIPIVNKVPKFNGRQDCTQYFINVSIGTPRQHFTVIFDTGSAVFGVFSKCVADAPTYGDCMFGGMRSQGSSLMNGVIFVMSISLGSVIIGIMANIFIRRWHNKQEEEKLKKFKRTGRTTESAFGPERIYGSFAEGEEKSHKFGLKQLP